MRLRTLVAGVLIALVAVIGTRTLGAQAGYAVDDLGSTSIITGLDANGTVIGYYNVSPGVQHAFVWTQVSGFVDIGTLGGPNSVPVAVNNSTVVGWSLTSAGQQDAFVWTQTSGMVDIGTLGGSGTIALAVNSYGVVVGEGLASNNQLHAFVWTQAGGMVDIGTLGGTLSSATAVNNNGMVAGWSYTAAGPSHAFVWTQAGGMTDIGSLPGISGTVVASINDNGLVIGDGIDPNTAQVHSFAWTQAGGMVDIGSLGGSTTALAVNNNGMVVGPGNISSTQEHAFVWTQASGLVDIATLGVNSSAQAVNDNGMVVGIANTTAGQHAFVWTQAGGMVDFTPDATSSRALYVNNNGAIAGVLGADAVVWMPTTNTATGSNVSVTPVDSTSGTSPISITFGDVTSGGTTSLTTSSTGAPPPAGFKIGNPPVYYDLSTTATFTGSATLCINYSGISYGNVSNLKLFHYENGVWVDRTSSLDTSTNTICATVASFSPFAIFETSYQFSGFFQPISNLPTVNSVKAGSGVPIKFSLNGNQGMNIVAAGSPYSQSMNCSDSTLVDDVSETITAGSSSLTYDPTSDQYIYVWKTDSPWAGTCRQLNVKLGDGTSHIANFQFKN